MVAVCGLISTFLVVSVVISLFRAMMVDWTDGYFIVCYVITIISLTLLIFALNKNLNIALSRITSLETQLHNHILFHSTIFNIIGASAA